MRLTPATSFSETRDYWPVIFESSFWKASAASVLSTFSLLCIVGLACCFLGIGLLHSSINLVTMLWIGSCGYASKLFNLDAKSECNSRQPGHYAVVGFTRIRLSLPKPLNCLFGKLYGGQVSFSNRPSCLSSIQRLQPRYAS